MAVRNVRHPNASPASDRYRRLADQAWEMAGLARRDGDHADAARRTEEARKYELLYHDALGPPTASGKAPGTRSAKDIHREIEFEVKMNGEPTILAANVSWPRGAVVHYRCMDGHMESGRLTGESWFNLAGSVRLRLASPHHDDMLIVYAEQMEFNPAMGQFCMREGEHPRFES